MRVVVAPDSFKESMTAAEAAEAMVRGVETIWPDAECLSLPLADGGEGTLAVLASPMGAQLRTTASVDAIGRPLEAVWGLAGDMAVIEAATVIGLERVPVELRDPRRADSGGLAAVFRAALDAGAKRFVIGIGGTATNDGGAGLLAGLGVRLLDVDGVEVDPTPDGLQRLDRVELGGLDPRLRQAELRLASDVTNPLLGPDGATAVFAAQKGAQADDLPVLESSLRRLADALVAAGLADVREQPGAGAAGGLGAALLALGARRGSGFDVVSDAIGLEAAVAGADLVLTGEGALDAQTASGKAPAGVLALGRKYGVPVIAFAGRIADVDAAIELGFTRAIEISPRILPLSQALIRGHELLPGAVASALVSWPIETR